MRRLMLLVVMMGSLAIVARGADDPAAKVRAFFKRVFEEVSASPDRAHYIAPRYQASYDELCRAVPNCEGALLTVFEEEYEYSESMHYRLNRMYKVLERLRMKKQRASSRLKRILPLPVARTMKSKMEHVRR